MRCQRKLPVNDSDSACDILLENRNHDRKRLLKIPYFPLDSVANDLFTWVISHK
jgi:hypothetical protein